MRKDWIEVNISKLSKTVSGGTPSTTRYDYWGGTIPWINSGKLKDCKINSESKFITKLGLNNSSAKMFPKNSVVIALTGATTAKVGLLEFNTTGNQSITAIFPGKMHNSTFLFFQLISLRQKILSQAIGSAQPHINKRIVDNLLIKLPSIPEQRSIVTKIEELFSDLDKGVADLKKAQNQLKKYRQAVLKKAFEGELTKEWREQQTDLPSAAELLEKIKIGRQEFFLKQIEEWEFDLKNWKEEGESVKKPKKPRPLTVPEAPNAGHEERKWDIPKNWIWTQIGDLCFVTKLAGFEYTDYVNYVEDGDLPVLKAENAGPNGFKKTDYSKVKSESVRMLTRSQIFGGELLVVFVGAGTGNVAMVPFNQRYFLGPNIGMARPYFKLDSKFIEMFLQSALGKNLMMSAVKAVAQPSLSMGTIRQAPVVFPSHKEQHRIVKEIETRLSVCDKVEESISESLEKAETLRQSILKKAFEGNLLSPLEIEKCKYAPDYEPAAVLLEKIKME